jgi:hypothetical protein
MTILSIDFDICMWQDIELYNNMVNSFRTIDDIMPKYPALKNVRFDANLYNRLTSLVMKLARKLPVDKIHFISTHEDIIKFVNNGKEDNKVINIDHHHDVCYNKAPIGPTASCANWVKYLYQNHMIQDYIHIGDSFSQMPLADDAIIIKEFLNIGDIGLDAFAEEVDELCICLSPAWVPSQYHGLFEAWATALGVMKNTKYKYR